MSKMQLRIQYDGGVDSIKYRIHDSLSNFNWVDQIINENVSSNWSWAVTRLGLVLIINGGSHRAWKNTSPLITAFARWIQCTIFCLFLQPFISYPVNHHLQLMMRIFSGSGTMFTSLMTCLVTPRRHWWFTARTKPKTSDSSICLRNRCFTLKQVLTSSEEGCFSAICNGMESKLISMHFTQKETRIDAENIACGRSGRTGSILAKETPTGIGSTSGNGSSPVG